MYSVLFYNYRVIKVVENFKEGKQMSHNKDDHGDRSGGLLIGYIGLITVPVALERTN